MENGMIPREDGNKIKIREKDERTNFGIKASKEYIGASEDDDIVDSMSYYALNPMDGKSEIASGWMTFISKLETCYKNKLPKTDPYAIDCIAYWRKVTTHFIGEDQQMENSILSFHATQENNQLKYGLTDELYQYLMGLMV